MAETNRQAQIDLDLNGRQIKHHLAAAERHRKGWQDHNKSAGLLLIASKARLSHGKWYGWLELHGIPHQTADKRMREASDPAALAARQAYDKKYNDERATAVKAQKDAEAKNLRTEAFEPKPSAVITSEFHTQCLREIKKLSPEQAQQVLQFITSL